MASSKTTRGGRDPEVSTRLESAASDTVGLLCDASDAIVRAAGVLKRGDPEIVRLQTVVDLLDDLGDRTIASLACPHRPADGRRGDGMTAETVEKRICRPEAKAELRDLLGSIKESLAARQAQ